MAMADTVLMVVGSLNREAPYFQGARGVGLSVFSFDVERGTAALICEESGVDNPTFLSLDPRRGCVYANSEVFGWHEGTVSAFRFDPEAGRLRYINKQPSLGSITAHSSLDPGGRHLFVANYGMGPYDEGPDRGIVIYPLRPDGGLALPVASLAHRGQGRDAARQERAHPHCVLPSPDGRFLVVADLGLDAIVTYGLGPDGQLADTPVATAPLPPGAGPRHLAFHPDGRTAVVICELDSTVRLLRYAADSGVFALLHTVPAVPAAARSNNHCSDVLIHPNGRFVYGANRGHDSIVVLDIDTGHGRLTPVAQYSCGGSTPRHLAIDPTGRFLVVANQNSDTLSFFAIDAAQGTLSPTGHDIQIGTPMCVAFMTMELA